MTAQSGTGWPSVKQRWGLTAENVNVCVRVCVFRWVITYKNKKHCCFDRKPTQTHCSTVATKSQLQITYEDNYEVINKNLNWLDTFYIMIFFFFIFFCEYY